VLPVLNPIAFNVVVPTGSWIVALGVLLALGGEISVPAVTLGVLPSFVYRTDEPAVASNITTGSVSWGVLTL
jgi:hypothetical protein